FELYDIRALPRRIDRTVRFLERRMRTSFRGVCDRWNRRILARWQKLDFGLRIAKSFPELCTPNLLLLNRFAETHRRRRDFRLRTINFERRAERAFDERANDRCQYLAAREACLRSLHGGLCRCEPQCSIRCAKPHLEPSHLACCDH